MSGQTQCHNCGRVYNGPMGFIRCTECPQCGAQYNQYEFRDISQTVTIETVGDEFYRNSPIAHNAVHTRIKKDDLIKILLKRVKMYEDEAMQRSLFAPAPTFVFCEHCSENVRNNIKKAASNERL